MKVNDGKLRNWEKMDVNLVAIDNEAAAFEESGGSETGKSLAALCI